MNRLLLSLILFTLGISSCQNHDYQHDSVDIRILKSSANLAIVKKPFYEPNVSILLDEKLNQYDRQRRHTPKGQNVDFTLSYDKSNDLKSFDDNYSAIYEQKERFRSFRSLNCGPKNDEEFYGFRMRFPVKTN